MKKACMLLCFIVLVVSMQITPLVASAATVIYDDTTRINVEDMDSHSSGVEPAKGMAIREKQWFLYEVESPVEADFKFILYYHYQTTHTLKLTLNDEVVFSGGLSDQSGGAKTMYSEVCTLRLKAGRNTIKLERVTADYHIDYFLLRSVKPLYGDTIRDQGAYKNIYLPAIIEAEDFNYGADGSYTKQKPVTNLYREEGCVTINKLGDGYGISIKSDEWIKYTVNVEYSGVYALKASTPSYGKLQVSIGGKVMPVNQLPGTPEYEEAELFKVYLDKGKYDIVIKSIEGELQFDYFRFVSSDSAEYIYPGEGTSQTEQNDEQTDVISRPVYKQFYVSTEGNDENDGSVDKPFRTISKAKNEVAKLTGSMSGDIIINVESGCYELTETEVFSNEHSGKNGYYVVIRGDERNKPIISGGKRIDNWEKVSDYIYKAPVEGQERVRNFYVNGYPAQRARSKYVYTQLDLYKEEGSSYSSDGIYVSKRNFPDNLTNIDDIELSWTNEWNNNRTPIEKITDNGDQFILHMQQPTWEIGTTFPYATTRAGIGNFYIENAKELLDEPGEFYYDKNEKMIYYYPFKAEDLNTAECFVGNVESLIEVTGTDIDNKVENIAFENLDFRHGEWYYCDDYGFVGSQAGNFYDTSQGEKETKILMQGQFSIEKAKNIDIIGCNFINLGSNAITMYNAASNIKVVGNTIRDIMGEAIAIGNPKHDSTVPEGHQMCSYITVKNNVIRRVAQGYMSGVGILAYYSNNVNIIHNDIADLPYTGISVGWGWGAEVPEMYNYIVSHNRVYNTVYILHDGAPFYSLGPARGTEIHDNYFVKSPRGMAGIYHDEGSSFMKTYNNVVEDCARFVFLNTGTTSDYISDNYSTTGEQLDKTGNAVIEGTTIVADAKWNDKAKSIINEAGLEANYRHLLDDAELPSYRSLLDVPKSKFSSKIDENIWAADYIDGGQGVAYYDTTAGNSGKAYKNDDVDIWTSSTIQGRYDVGIDPGEWIKWNVNIEEDGNYNLVMWTANSKKSSPPMPSFNMYINDEKIVSEQPITYTGNSSVYKYTTVNNLQLSAGPKEIKIEGVNGFFGICYFSFEKVNDSYLSNDFDEGVVVLEKEKIRFYDMENHWAKTEVEQLVEKNIVNGVGNNLFNPEGNLTVKHAVLMLLRALDKDASEETWKKTAVQLGLISEDAQDNKDITREEFVNIVMKAYMTRNRGYNVYYSLLEFVDTEDINSEYLYPILGAKRLGLVKGDDKNMFRPKSNLSRAEASVVIVRFLDI